MAIDQAVVLGAGIGGLLAAGVLARYVGQVIVLEKDEINLAPADKGALPQPRKGVPQGPQVHAILKGGENVIAGIFPDFRARLLAAGGTAVKIGPELHVYEGGGWHPEGDSGVVLHTQTRALLEQVIRGCLLDLTNVQFRSGCRVTGLLLSGDGRTRRSVQGVRISVGGSTRDKAVYVPMVVDAMGRGSRMPAWLAAHGCGALRYARAGIDVSYTTLLLHRPAAYRGKPDGWVIRATAPDIKRGATMMAIEGERWLLTLVSRFGDVAPNDFPGCLEFTKTIEGGVIYDLVQNAELASPPKRFMIPEAILAHFDQLSGLPVGLLPLGDVVGTFNPQQAQGMTVAALHAKALNQALLRQSDRGADLAGLSSDYVNAAVQISTTAWQTAVNADFSYSETMGDRPPDLAAQQQFRRAVRDLLEIDPDLHRLAVEVQQMLRPPSALQRDDVLARAAAIAKVAAPQSFALWGR